MGTYKLEEESPNTFISPIHLGNRFVYRMFQFNSESDYEYIRDIDLRKDRLFVQGTEIKEPILQQLYDTLRLRSDSGRIYVNSNGACYIVVVLGHAKEHIRPIDNVIFDWSRFGVTLPNSVNDIFCKQLQQKDHELESSKEEAKRRVTELEEQIFRCKKESEEQLCLVNAELQSTKDELESSNENVRELEYQLSSCMKQNEDSIKELHNVQNEVSFGNIELESTRSKLDSFNKKIEQLEYKLSSYKNESEAKDAKLHSLTMNELQDMKILLEFTEKGKEDTSLGECSAIKAIEIVDDVIVN